MTLTRSELYNRMREAPLSRRDTEFGLTGTALAAICRQREIPSPGSSKSLGTAAELPPSPTVSMRSSKLLRSHRPRGYSLGQPTRFDAAGASVAETSTKARPAD